MVRDFCDRWRRYTETDEYRKLPNSVESRMRCRNLRPGSRPLLGQNWNTFLSGVRSGSPIGFPRISRIGIRWRHRSRTCGPIWDELRTKTQRPIAHTARSAPCASRLGNGQHVHVCGSQSCTTCESRSREQVRMSRYISSDLCFELRFGWQHQYVCLLRIVFVPYKFRPFCCCSIVSFQ